MFLLLYLALHICWAKTLLTQGRRRWIIFREYLKLSPRYRNGFITEAHNKALDPVLVWKVEHIKYEHKHIKDVYKPRGSSHAGGPSEATEKRNWRAWMPKKCLCVGVWVGWEGKQLSKWCLQSFSNLPLRQYQLKCCPMLIFQHGFQTRAASH